MADLLADSTDSGDPTGGFSGGFWILWRISFVGVADFCSEFLQRILLTEFTAEFVTARIHCKIPRFCGATF